MPLFSVVIPAFNRAGTIAATLRSVAEQTCRDFEVIVVDDASTDETCAVVERAGGARLLRQPNAGPGVARNTGAEAATGAYLAFLDSDDVWFPWTLEVMAELIARHRPSIISGLPVMFSADAELAGIARAATRADVYADYFASDPETVLPGAGLMTVRREAFLSAGGFTSARVYGEDTECYMRLGVAPGVLAVRGPVTLGYRRHAGSAMMNTAKIIEGRHLLLAEERAGRYPGGAARKRERERMIGHHCRFPAVNGLYGGAYGPAFGLWAATLGMNLRQGRWRFALGFPLMAAAVATGLRRRPATMHGVPTVPAQHPPTSALAA
ncbi:MAG: glycosyltransferase family 2 protein [Phycisphaerales bacterium]